MNKTFAAAAPGNPTEIEAAIKEMLAEMDQMDNRVREKQKRIDKLKAETRSILNTFKA